MDYILAQRVLKSRVGSMPGDEWTGAYLAYCKRDLRA